MASEIIEGNKIGPEGAQTIASALMKNYVLASLNLCLPACIPSLGNNKVGDEGAKAFAAVLKRNHVLSGLYLGTLRIDSRSF